MYFFVISALIIVIDQVSKWLVVSQLSLNDRVPVIGDFFQITSHRNTGAAFGILTGQRWLFVLLTIAVTIGLVWYIFRSAKRGLILAPLAYSFVLGGAIGNLIDRMRTGEVVDFFKFRFQFDWFGTAVDYTYPIFNVADMMIVSGVILALIQVWRDRDQEKRDAVADA